MYLSTIASSLVSQSFSVRAFLYFLLKSPKANFVMNFDLFFLPVSFIFILATLFPIIPINPGWPAVAEYIYPSANSVSV